MHKMQPTQCLLTFALLFLVPGPVVLNAQNIPGGDWVGTWKFVPAESKFPGRAPLEDQVTVDADGMVTVHQVDANGKSSDWHYKPEQGKAVPVVGRGENVTVTATMVSATRNEQEWNFNGMKASGYAVLSDDRKTQTLHLSGTTRDGRPFSELIVFAKQKP